MKTEGLIFVCLYILGILESCETRHIGHEIIQVTQRSQSPRSRRDVDTLMSEDFPDKMEFTLHLKHGDKKLVLTKHSSPHDVIMEDKDGVVHFDPQKTQYAVYQDTNSFATMIVDCGQLSETCTLEGTFYHDLIKWNLNPLHDLKGRYNVTKSTGDFQSSQTAQVKPGNSASKRRREIQKIYEKLSEDLKKEDKAIRQKRGSSDCNFIEFEVLADASVWDYFQGQSQADGADLLRRHYLAVFSSDPGSDWTNSFLGNGNVDGLNTLLNCGNQRDGSTTADLLVCTTRFNIEFGSDPDLLRSLAFSNVVCQSGLEAFQAFISEDLGDDTDLVIASSLLGPLFVPLDSTFGDPACDTNLQFIGSDFNLPPHDNETITNPWKFSNCSRDQIQMTLDMFDSTSNCLKTSGGPALEFPEELPGELFDLDFQCQNAFGLASRATIGPNETSVFDVADICWKGVYCNVGGDNSFRTRVYNGSPCGCKKICLKNECIRDFGKSLGGECVDSCDCTENNTICDCDAKTCVCADGFAPDDLFIGNATCVPVEPPGGSCVSNESCADENSFCNMSNICECNPGFLLRDGVCLKSCEDDTLPYVANGVYLPQDWIKGSVANLLCAKGYAANSFDTCAVCTHDGWSQPTGQCIRDCECPPLVPNGDYIVDNFPVPDKRELIASGPTQNTFLLASARLICCEGYSTSRPVTITCEDTEQGWSTPDENCTINDCGSSLPYIANGGFVASHGTTVGSIGTLQCDPGYTPMSEDSCIVCLTNGTWSAPKTECIRDCGCPPVVSNGDLVLKTIFLGRKRWEKPEPTENTLLGAIAHLECCEGYSTEYSVTITCEDTAQGWSTPSQNCTINDCGSSLPYVQNGGYVANHGTTVGSIGTLVCDSGYVPVSEDSCIVCLFNGTWSAPKTECIRDCGCPPVVSNGDLVLKTISVGRKRWIKTEPEENTLLGAMAHLECCEGYSTEYSVTITCEDTAQGWSTPSQNCTINDCGSSLPYVQNGGYVANHGTTVGSIGTLVCDSGYVPVPEDSCIVCLFNGTWSAPKTECIRDCGCPPVVSNGDLVLKTISVGRKRWIKTEPEENTLLGAMAHLECCEGYSTEYAVTITCEDTAQGWSTPSQNCTINDCGGSLPYVQNGGYVANHGTTVGSIGTLVCDSGYVPVSEDSCIVCLFNGTWSAPKTECIRDCGCPPVVSNGDYVLKSLVEVRKRIPVIEENTLLGAMAHLECCDGYSTEYAVTITCEDTAQGWSFPSDNCTLNDCGSSLPYVANGGYVANHGTTVGSIGVLQCDFGYTPISDEDCIVCLFNGTWDAPKTECIRDCGTPPVPFGGRFELDMPGNTTLGAMATLVCCEVCDSTSTIKITCEDTELGWSAPAENCTVNDCGPTFPNVTNGAYQVSGTLIGSFGQLVCDYGYTPNATEICIVCLPNGIWTNPGTGCIRDCGQPPKTVNGDFMLDPQGSTTLGSTSLLVCDDGFSTMWKVIITCEDTEAGWSMANENCTINDCGGSLPYVQNGGYVANHGTTVGSIGTLVCDSGYVPVSEDSCIVCLFNGTWSAPKTECIRDCGCPPVVSNGDLVLKTISVGIKRWIKTEPEENTLLGAMADLECCEGYSTEYAVTITCEDTAQGWSTPSQSCTINDCGDSLPYVSNGVYVPKNETTVGALATLECDDGYVPESCDTCINCLTNGNWSAPHTTCIRDCGSPPIKLNGQFVLDEKDCTTIGDTATLVCDNGYSSMSEATITCEDNLWGWSPSKVTCDLNDCGSSLPYVWNGGYVANHGTTVGSIATLDCAPGYSPESCDLCIVCLFNGTWSAPKTTCIRDCGPPPIKEHGKFWLREPEFTLYSASAELSCDHGFVSSYGETPVYITCDDDGWSSHPAYCGPKDCGPSVHIVDHGEYFPADATYVGCLAYLECEVGYAPKAFDVAVTCGLDGYWTAPQTHCIRDCGPPPHFLHGVFKLEAVEVTTVGATAQMFCDHGFHSSTDADVWITCEDNLTGWSAFTATCEINVCDDAGLPSVDNGNYVSQGNEVGAAAILECDADFLQFPCDAPCSVCQMDGSWTEPNVTCVPKSVLGEKCNPGECIDGLVCNLVNYTCECSEGGSSCLEDTKRAIRDTSDILCPNGFEQFEGSCYLFGTEEVYHSEAMDICDGFDTDVDDCRLVQIDSETELKFLKDFIIRRDIQPHFGYWNDLFQFGDNGVSERWYTTGDPLIIHDWDTTTDQPDDNSGEVDEFCTVFARENLYKWTDVECKSERGGTDRSKYFPLCEIDKFQGTRK